MTDMTLEIILRKIIEEKPTTTFLVAGNTLRGDIHSYGLLDSAMFVYIRECADVEKTISELADGEQSEIVLVQYECYVSQIWQLTVQAFIEHFGISDHVKRICFQSGQSDFYVTRIDEIPVKGAYDAYGQFVCKHQQTALSQYLIDEEAVEYYLDIYSPTSQLHKYICETSAKFDSPYNAYGVFCRDYPNWGLSDSEFMMIAMEVLTNNLKHAGIAKKWGRKLRK